MSHSTYRPIKFHPYYQVPSYYYIPMRTSYGLRRLPTAEDYYSNNKVARTLGTGAISLLFSLEYKNSTVLSAVSHRTNKTLRESIDIFVVY